jgi:hypothetical protein
LVNRKNKYNVTDVDITVEPMGPNTFYTEYLSKSLPAVFRNGAKDSFIFNEIQAA